MTKIVSRRVRGLAPEWPGSCVSHDALNPISHPAGNWCDLLCPFPLAQSLENQIRLAVLTVNVAFWAERSSDEKVFRLFTEQHYGASGYVCQHPSRQVSPGIVTLTQKGTEPPTLEQVPSHSHQISPRLKNCNLPLHFILLLLFDLGQKGRGSVSRVSQHVVR